MRTWCDGEGCGVDYTWCDYTWCDHMVCHHGVVWSVDCGVPNIVPYIYTAYLSHWGGPAPMLPEVV